jgi:hypothetical protein
MARESMCVRCRILQDLGLHLVDSQLYAVVMVLVVAGMREDAPR